MAIKGRPDGLVAICDDFSPGPVGGAAIESRAMHLRPPSIDHGTASGLWAILFWLILFFGSMAIGVGMATAFIVSSLLAFAIFLFVRLYGEEPLRPD
jgi:hypothetical protein